MKAMFRIVAVFAMFAASLSAARAGLNLIHDGSFSQAGAVGNITWNGFVSAASIQTGANPIVGWQTTAPDGQLEIWKAGADGIPAPIGATYWAELNAWYVSTLFQVVRLDLALPVSFSLAHRGRLGTDTMDLTIYDIGLATNWAPGQGTQVYSERMSDGNTAWG